MATHLDSASIITTANTISQVFQVLWPVITAILAYVTGHWFTSKPKKVIPPAAPKV